MIVQEDVAIAARAMHVYWRARTLCASAEPHQRPYNDSCERHYDEARRQLSTTAQAPATGVPRPPGAGVCGVVEAVSASAGLTGSATPPSEKEPGLGAITPQASGR